MNKTILVPRRPVSAVGRGRWLPIIGWILVSGAGWTGDAVVVAEQAADPDEPIVAARVYSYVNITFCNLERYRDHYFEPWPRDARIEGNIALFAPSTIIPGEPINFLFDFEKDSVVDAFVISIPPVDEAKGKRNKGAEYLGAFEVFLGDGQSEWMVVGRSDERIIAGRRRIDFEPARARFGRLRIRDGVIWDGFPFEVLGFRKSSGLGKLPVASPIEGEKPAEMRLVRMILDEIREPKPATPKDIGSDHSLKTLIRFADLMLEHGRDHYGPRETPLFVNILDARTHRIPGTQRPCTPNQRFHDRLPGGANLLMDIGLIRFLNELTARTGDKRYQEAATDYIHHFTRQCIAPATGFYTWGTHACWDVFRNQPLYAHPYHEFLPRPPVWLLERMWPADPEKVERGLDALKYHCTEPGAAVPTHSRHARIDQKEYLEDDEYMCDFAFVASGYCVAWAFLDAQTHNPEYRRRIERMMDYYWNSRDPQTGLMPWDTRLDRFVYRTDAMLYVARDLLLIAQLLNDPVLSDEYRGRARQLADAALRLDHDPAAGKVVLQTIRIPEDRTGLSEMAVTHAERYARGPRASEPFWATGFNTCIQTARSVRPLIQLYDELGVPAYLDFAEQTALGYAAMEIPGKTSDIEAFTTASVLGLCMDVYERRPSDTLRAYIHKLASQATENYFTNDLITATPSLDYYESASGSGELAAELLRALSFLPDQK